ncbi:YceI family protein [Gemmobacter lanyuensis]
MSQSIRVTGPNTGVVEGLLTILGQTHPARLDVTFNGSMAEHPMMGVAKIGFSATGVIRRSDWGWTMASPSLAMRSRSAWKPRWFRRISSFPDR